MAKGQAQFSLIQTQMIQNPKTPKKSKIKLISREYIIKMGIIRVIECFIINIIFLYHNLCFTNKHCYLLYTYYRTTFIDLTGSIITPKIRCHHKSTKRTPIYSLMTTNKPSQLTLVNKLSNSQI